MTCSFCREMGTWRANQGAVVADVPGDHIGAAEDYGYYGGRLIGESITRRNAIAISFLPQLLAAAEENAVGRRVLAQLAHALVTPDPPRLPVRDRLDGVLRLAQLANDFQHAGGRVDEWFAVAELLRAIAHGLFENRLEHFAGVAVDNLRGSKAAAS